MATKTKEREYTAMQLWPGGQCIHVSGERDKMAVRKDRQGRWRQPTDDERRAIRIEQLAEKFQREGVLHCDSSLVGDLMKLGDDGRSELGDEFSYENVANMRTDPSNWGIEKCKKWLEDHGHDLPEGRNVVNPWAMSRKELLVALALIEEAATDEERAAEEGTDEDLLASLIEQIDDERIDGLDEWREAVSDNAEDAEIYEWWRVDDWLAGELDAVGECVLDNAYGKWWGRCCTGQSMIMDGTFQEVAVRFLNRYPD